MNKNLLITLIIMCASILSSFKSNAQDWANLKMYQTENELILSKPENHRLIVFMGNSITQQWKEKRPEFFSQNFYVCRGISGQTTPQILIRFRQDVVDLKPKAVVILAGINDIAGNTGPSTLKMIMDNLESMTEIAQANHIKVYLSSVLPAFDYPWRKGMEPNIKIPKLNIIIREYCQKKGIHYLNFFSAMNDGNNGMKPEYTVDGVHCTPKGYEVMEAIVQKALK
jgi:lysophospholipase L1-like esterase